MAHSGVRVIHLTGPSVAGTFPQEQDVVITDTPPNVIPKGAIFFSVSHSGLSNTIALTSRIGVGFADDAVTERCVMAFAENGVAAASADCGYRIDNSTVVQISNPTNVNLLAEGNVTEFITNGVTLSWSAVNNVQGQIVLFYGDDVEAQVVNFNGSATEDGTASISGLAFAPDIIFLISGDRAFGTDTQGADPMLSFGFAARTSDTQACSCLVWEHQQSPTESGVISKDTVCAVRLTSTAGTVAEGASLELTSWNSDGATFTTRNDSYSLRCAALCVKLPNTSAWAGAPTIPAGTLGAFSRTDPQFLPQALIFAPVRAASVDAVTGQGSLCLGCTDAYETGEVSAQARDNQATSGTGVDWSSSRSFSVITIPGSSDWDYFGTVTSFDTLGWSGAITNAAAANRPMVYLAISHPAEIIGNETVGITEGHVFQQNPLRALSETVGITEGHVFMQNAVGTGGIVGNETVGVTEGCVFTARTVFNEDVGITEDCVLLAVSHVYDETVGIEEGLIFVGDGTLVANETVGITEGNVLLITGLVLVANETVGITEEYNDGPGPVPIKGTWRGTTLSGGSEAGAVLTAGSERGTVRG